jgi:hypothetical protein
MSFYIYFRYSSASVRPGTGNADLGLLIEKLEQWSSGACYIVDSPSVNKKGYTHFDF